MVRVHAQDLREMGKGLIGLDLDIIWNSKKYEITQDDLNQSQIFDKDHLPLFQNKGKVEIDDTGKTSISNSSCYPAKIRYRFSSWQ